MRPKHLEELLKKTIPSHLPVLIKGAPGIGKTDIVKSACRDLDAELIISHPVVCDPVDFKGMPFVSNGEASFLPFGDLRQLINAEKLTVFFLDDLGQAPPAVQAAAMQLILGRRINGHKVSQHVTFVAATNRKKDKAGVSGILEPVKSRFCSIIELQPELDDWCSWALDNNVQTELICFIRMRPELLFKFEATSEIKNSPCPRTVENVSRLLKTGIPKEIEFETIAGAVGEGFASELIGFLKIWRNIPNPDVVLMSPDTAEVPTDAATLYAICGALARKASQNNFERIVKYANRLPDEFSVLLINDSQKRNPEVIHTRGWIEWQTKNSAVMI